MSQTITNPTTHRLTTEDQYHLIGLVENDIAEIEKRIAEWGNAFHVPDRHEHIEYLKGEVAKFDRLLEILNNLQGV